MSLFTGEVLSLRSSHLLSSSQSRQVLISLGLTKGGKCQCAAESAILGYEPAVLLVKRWKTFASDTTPLASSPGAWRKLFNEGLEAFQMSKYGFRPYIPYAEEAQPFGFQNTNR